jgi:biotin operon repressor
MRRADRLFLIIHALRGRRTALPARNLAGTLGVSLRTVYRDVADLQLSGVPIEGEAGVGYVLRKGSDIPPLMFTADELESLVVGTRFVRAFAGDKLAAGAQAALLKIEAVLPPDLRERAARTRIYAPSCGWTTATRAAAPACARSSRCAWRSGAASGRWARGAGCAPISATSAPTASLPSTRPANASPGSPVATWTPTCAPCAFPTTGWSRSGFSRDALRTRCQKHRG